mgnify:FL=1
MSTIITLLCFVLVLGVTVFIHELGHFLFAKKAGIYCYEFSLGMGPVLWKFNRKNDETTYAIRLFPIGGFVQMAGEAVDLDEDIPEDKRMQSKTWMQRFLTVSAGVLFNFLLALVIFFIVGMITGTDDQKAYVGSIGENFKVSSSNLQVGDQILKVNGKNSWSSNKTLLLLMVNSGKNLSLDVKHADGTKENIIIEPTLVKEVVDDNNNVTYEIVSEKTDDSEYKFGIGLKTKSTSVKVNSIKDFFSNVYHGVIYAFVSFASLIDQMVYTCFYLLTGKLSLTSLSGPVGIYQVVGESAKYGFINVVYLIGYICVNVGFINLLPLPAFDGGRVFFMIIEAIRKKPVSPKVENIIHAVGLVLLMILMVVITFNDILRLFVK